ncbi:MAG: LysR family transcriptional regulator [Deltaproteobacteria bacterium]|nr:LysR family transcriptional regulator [Candidatus Anaeroferrophillus wilburensis]MBN2888116.1 LysR family transcriptional regulator [Deltaproteobacteria bacterium]
MLETRHLQVFLAICKLHSFSRAAEEVNLTQPTVSGHIRTLETLLGTQLFNRAGREITPTKAGKLLLPYARKILNLQEQAEWEMELYVGKKKGTLEIGGSNIPGEYILPLAIGIFKHDRPIIRITLKIGSTAEIIEAVGDGRLELGMVGAVLDQPDIIYQPCLVDELVLVAPPDSPLTSDQQLDVSQLTKYPFVMREPGSGTRDTIEEALLRAAGPQYSDLPVIAEMGSTEAIRQAVKAGVGYSIISRRAVSDDIAQGLIQAPELTGINLKRQFYLIFYTLSPLAADFHQFLKRHFIPPVGSDQ